MKNSLFFLLLIFTLSSCNRQDGKTFSADQNSASGENTEELEPADLVKYVQSDNNGLKQKAKSDELIYTALYKPIDYVICMEEASEEISKQLADTKRKELEPMQYIDIKIENTEGGFLQNGNPEEYSRRINYCSFEMQKDFCLIEGDDTLSCGLFHFERTYDIAPYATFLLGFPVTKQTQTESRMLLFNDRLFNKGTIRFVFKNEDIKKTPGLKTI